MIKRIIPILLFIGLVWGQLTGKVVLKSGLEYNAIITEANESYIYIQRANESNPQGLPTGIVYSAITQDGIIIFENGKTKYHINNGKLIEPKKTSMTDDVEPKKTSMTDDVEIQTLHSNKETELSKLVKIHEKIFKYIRCWTISNCIYYFIIIQTLNP